MSSSDALGNITDSLPSIGDTANPGNALRADMDHIHISVIRGIVPWPV